MAVLRFRVDTPLFVLGGGSVLVGLDAFYRDGYLYLVDITSPRLVAAAAARPSLEEVIRLASSRPADYAYRRLPSPPIPDKTEVRLGVVPPASTVKGLLRTAYLWLALTRDERLAEAFLRAVAEALDEGVYPKFVGSEGEALVFRRELEGGRRWDVFNSVIVREGRAEARFRVYRVDVYERAGVKTSFYAAGLEPGSRLEYEVVVRPRPREDGRAEHVVTEEGLKEALRLFSRELTAFERARGLYVPQCDAVRLGFGAGRRWKTVLSLIERRSPDLFRRLESYMTQRLGHVWGDTTVKMAEGRPVGWACYEWG
jgi:CRISPR-associated protein Csm5